MEPVSLWMRPTGLRARARSVPPRALAALAVVVTASMLVVAGQIAPPPPSTPTASDSAGDRGGVTAIGAVGAIAPGSLASGAPMAMPFDDRIDRRGTLIAPADTLTGYRWPVEHARITQAFGPSAGGSFVVAGEAFHDGIDIANFCGAPIVAAHDGVVLAAGRRVDAALGWIGNLAAYHDRLDAQNLWGTLANIVVIDDGNGYRSIYAHFHSIAVKVGQSVRAGDLIGTEGATGHASGCHLHYGLFSPNEAGRFETDPALVKRTLLPAAEIARVDPLIVLPPLATAFITWGWGARDTP